MKRKSKKIKIVLLIVAFLALLGAAGYTVFIAPMLKKDQWIYKEVVVQRGTLAVGVTESGALTYAITELNYDLDLDIKSDDDDEEEEAVVKYLKVEDIYVAAGQRIEKGDQLVKFQPDSITAVRRQLQGALVEAKTDYNEAQGDYELSVLEANLEYESSLIDSKYAKSIYQSTVSSVSGDLQTLKLQLQDCKNSQATLEQRLEEAQEGYDELRTKYEEAKKLWETVEVTDTVNFTYYEKAYLNAQSSYQNATDQIKQAKQAIETNKKEIESLNRQISAANAAKKLNLLEVDETYQESVLSGENAQVIYDSTVEGLKEDLQKARDTLEEAQKRLDDFEAFVGEDGVLYAAESGIVTEVSCEAGQSLERTQTLVTYAKPDEMTISVDVTQEDVVNLLVGDRVSITFTAYPDVPYEGLIGSIETTATSRNTDTVSYTVVVNVQGDTQGLYGGMTSDVIFVLEEKEDVLYVSRKAIVEEEGKTCVCVKDAAGNVSLKEVTVGVTNGVNTEILSGLQEGDVIYLASKVSSEADVTGSSEDAGDNGGSTKEGKDAKSGGGSMPDFGNVPSGGGTPGGRDRNGGGNSGKRGGNR